MQPTPEKPRGGWAVLLMVWAACAVLIGSHARAVRDYVESIALRGGSGTTAAVVPLRPFVPARYADALMWVRHTETARATGTARVRFTDADNAPLGREVHWASGFRWSLDGLARLRQAATGEPAATALERSLVWINAVVLFGALLLLSAWAARRAGPALGVLVAAAMLGLPRFYQTFEPFNADHHGLISGALLGLTLGLTGAGLGWWQGEGRRAPLLPASREAAIRAARFSAVCGALGMWISAASTIPAITITGLAGLAAALWGGGGARAAGARFEPAVWRSWGRLGAALSGVFYLLEYAPGHLGFRLEVNHPAYAAAWWGGGELIATVAAWRLAPAGWTSATTRRCLLPLLAAVLPLVLVIAGGAAVFTLRDPFVAQLRHYVIEGQTLATTIRRIGAGPFAWDAVLLLVLPVTAVLAARARGTTRVVLLFLVLATAAWVPMAVAEMRWLMVMSTAQAALLVVLAALALPRGPRWRIGVPAAALLIAAVLCLLRIGRAREKMAEGWIEEDDGVQLLYRDIAAVLRAQQPEGDLVLLASPGASLSIAYYTGGRALGTLYWENIEGLKAAAQIFSARTEAEAAGLVRARRVTHVALVSSAPFLDEYFRLLRPDEPLAHARTTFGFRLLTEPGNAPAWLQPIAYRRRVGLVPFGKVVRLFQVAFDQTEGERLYHTAIAELARDELSAAEATLERAFAATPRAGHAALAEAAGAAFYDYGADAAAVRQFRRALEFGYDPLLATTTAWILASTAQPALRDGRAALALLEPQLARPPDEPSFLSALAAAWAELGRFEDAAGAAEHALGLARAAGDKASEPILQKRLESYRARRAWSQ